VTLHSRGRLPSGSSAKGLNLHPRRKWCPTTVRASGYIAIQDPGWYMLPHRQMQKTEEELELQAFNLPQPLNIKVLRGRGGGGGDDETSLQQY